MRKYQTLLRHANSQRGRFLAIAGLTLASSLLTVCQPWPMKLVADQVLGQAPLPEGAARLWQGWVGGLSPTGLLLAATGAGLLLFALTSAVEAALALLWTAAGRRVVYDLAHDLFDRLQRRSLIYHLRSSTADRMNRVTEDCWCLYRLLDALAIAPVQALMTLVTMVILMARLDGALALWAVVLAPLMVGASFLVGRPLHAAARLKREIESRVQAHIQQALTGIPVVQAFAQEDREQQRFRQFADAAIRTQQRGALLGGINSLSSGLVTTLGVGTILYLGARHVLDGRLSVGGILVFVVYLTSLQSQVRVLANLNAAWRSFSASLDRVIETVEAAPEVQDQARATPLPRVRGQIRFDRVVFGYETGHPVLRGLSLEASPGQTMAIVGASGAGKTTLVSLIPRFFDPWEGRVLIDGTDVREVGLRSLRQQVALVLQDPFLFPLSVAENIAYGRPQATRAEIEAAARAANASVFIEKLPEGYETVLGERGTTLSGGERQRLSIARALLKDAPILILDEPTSALDAETERLILEALSRLMLGRNTFIIAHRLSTVRQADRIAVLHDGGVAESGTHAELMARGRLYAHLHNIQFEPNPSSAGPMRE